MAGFSSKNIFKWAAALSVLGHATTLWVGSKLNIGAADSTTSAAASRDDGLVFVFDDAPPVDPLPQETQTNAAPEPVPQPPLSEPAPVVVIKPPEPQPESEIHIRPGIDQSDQNTPNWIGFADPTPHAARKATTAQPALDPKPAAPGEESEPTPPASESAPAPAPLVIEPTLAAASGSEPPATQPVVQPQEQPEVETTASDPLLVEASTPTERAELNDGPKQEAIDDLHRPEGDLVEGDAVERPFVGPPEPTPAERAQFVNDAAAAKVQQNQPPQPATRLATAPAPREARSPKPRTSSPSASQSLSNPDPAATERSSPAAPAIGGGQPAEASDRESDATSLDEALIVIPGRPAAAEGLEIVTKRPVFSRYVRTVASPENPVYDVTFGRSGQVVKAVMLKSSGYPDVDDPVYNALLAWRATGRRLAQIGPGKQDGLTLTIQVVLR